MTAPPPQMQDWYKVLGVSRDADVKEIKRVYRQLALSLHPGTWHRGHGGFDPGLEIKRPDSD